MMSDQSIYNIRDRWPLEKSEDAPAPKTKLWAETIKRLKHAKG